MPIQVNYFQGPRYRIALTLLWRSGSDASMADPHCGIQEGDNYYFNQSSSGPIATSNYLSLYDAGSKEVPAANFYLPTGVVNPCVLMK